MFRQNFDFKVLQHKESEEPQEVVGEQGRNLRGSTKLCVEIASTRGMTETATSLAERTDHESHNPHNRRRLVGVYP